MTYPRDAFGGMTPATDDEAFQQGYDLGFKHGREEAVEQIMQAETPSPVPIYAIAAAGFAVIIAVAAAVYAGWM